MRYVSTRAASADASEPFSDILLEGLAPDGGLYLPVTYPRVDAQTLTRWRAVLAEQGYAALAAEVIGLYIDDIGHDDLLELCRRAYTAEKFGDPQIVPVTRIGDEPLWLSLIHI